MRVWQMYPTSCRCGVGFKIWLLSCVGWCYWKCFDRNVWHQFFFCFTSGTFGGVFRFCSHMSDTIKTSFCINYLFVCLVLIYLSICNAVFHTWQRWCNGIIFSGWGLLLIKVRWMLWFGSSSKMEKKGSFVNLYLFWTGFVRPVVSTFP